MYEIKPRRRWLSFGIRDLLWAMVVVGLVIGWYVDHGTTDTKLKRAMHQRDVSRSRFDRLVRDLDASDPAWKEKLPSKSW